MKELAPHTRVYIVLVVLAGYLALGRLFLDFKALSDAPEIIRSTRLLQARPEGTCRTLVG